MSDQSISNPGGAFGQTAQQGTGGFSLINGTTSTIGAHCVVIPCTSAVQSVKPAALAASLLAIGVAEAAIPSLGVGRIITRGFTLVAVSSTDVITAQFDQLVVSTSTVSAQGVVKTSTAATPIGSIIGIALSTALDASGTFIPAYIAKQ